MTARHLLTIATICFTAAFAFAFVTAVLVSAVTR